MLLLQTDVSSLGSTSPIDPRDPFEPFLNLPTNLVMVPDLARPFLLPCWVPISSTSFCRPSSMVLLVSPNFPSPNRLARDPLLRTTVAGLSICSHLSPSGVGSGSKWVEGGGSGRREMGTNRLRQDARLLGSAGVWDMLDVSSSYVNDAGAPARRCGSLTLRQYPTKRGPVRSLQTRGASVDSCAPKASHSVPTYLVRRLTDQSVDEGERQRRKSVITLP